MKACELQALVEAEVQLERRKNEITEALHKSTLMREECLATYREIRRKRELLEKLRSRKLAEYTREQSQAEQRRIDDVYLSRRKRTQ
jgi:flagellar biosynthesis chaperone FliJ